MPVPSRKNYGIEARLAMFTAILAITWSYGLGIDFTSWGQVNRAFWSGILLYMTGIAIIFGSLINKEET